MKVAVYSGSFNPFHIGHLSVIRHLLDHCGFDMVYLVVSPQNPFKDKSMTLSGEQRLKAVKNAVERNGLSARVKVDDIEFSMPVPSYTIRTLDALQEREPKNRFTYVIGGDNLHEMLDWREGGRLMSQYGIAVYPRKGFDLKRDCRKIRARYREESRTVGNDGQLTFKPLKIKLLNDAPMIDISSSEIRGMIERGEDVSKLLG